MSMPLPDVPDTAKVTDGNDRMNETRQQLNALATRVTPVVYGGTGGATKVLGRAGLGINSGASLPGTADDGDVFFLLV